MTRLTIFLIVGIMTEAHSFRRQVGIGSESDCLLGLSNKILKTSYSEVGLKQINHAVRFRPLVKIQKLWHKFTSDIDIYWRNEHCIVNRFRIGIRENSGLEVTKRTYRVVGQNGMTRTTRVQGRLHIVDLGGHVTFSWSCSWDWCKSRARKTKLVHASNTCILLLHCPCWNKHDAIRMTSTTHSSRCSQHARHACWE